MTSQCLPISTWQGVLQDSQTILRLILRLIISNPLLQRGHMIVLCQVSLRTRLHGCICAHPHHTWLQMYPRALHAIVLPYAAHALIRLQIGTWSCRQCLLEQSQSTAILMVLLLLNQQSAQPAICSSDSHCCQSQFCSCPLQQLACSSSLPCQIGLGQGRLSRAL